MEDEEQSQGPEPMEITDLRRKEPTAALPFVEKYRPEKLDDVVSQNDIVTTLKTFIERKKLPHMIFHGPPGTGKTSCILALAKTLYGPHYHSMALELNASDERGIDVVRDIIKNFCSTRQIIDKGMKLVILDECDSMTSAAQFALRRIIEKFTSTTRFCLSCNYVSKIIPAILSRCTRFRFTQLKSEFIEKRLIEIAKSEKILLEPGAEKAIVQLAEGDMRKVLNMLESCSMGRPDKMVTIPAVYQSTGKPSPQVLEEIYKSLLEKTYAENINLINTLMHDKGLALDDIIKGLHKLVLATQFPMKMKAAMVEEMSEIEYRLTFGGLEKIQVAALVGTFIYCRTITSK